MAKITVSLSEGFTMTTTEVEISDRTAKKIFQDVVDKMTGAAVYQKRKEGKVEWKAGVKKPW